MADEAKNGIPDVDKSPESTENDENEVKSPIVMRIDAPDSAPSVDPEPPAVSFSGTRGFFSNTIPSVCSPNRVFSSISSTIRFPGLSGGEAKPWHGFSRFPGTPADGLFGQSTETAPTNPWQPLLRPSSLAVSSDVSSTEPDDGVAAPSEPPVNERFAASSTVSTASTSTALPVKFMPLGGPSLGHREDSGAVGGTGGVSSSVTGFVFGQNLRERAVATDAPDSTSTSRATSTREPVANSNGTATSEMLFTSVIQSEPPAADSSGSSGAGGSAGGSVGASGGAESKSLLEAAAEYEESRAVKRTYQQVALFTGEEDEENIQQVNCKLFAYDGTTGQYVERGRGTLRLNDRAGPGGTHSRVVMRTGGSLRVVLNTKVWAGMLVDRASPKSVRITAMESPGQIKVFLVTASPKEIDGLCKSLQLRVARRQAAEGEPGGESEPDAESGTESESGVDGQSATCQANAKRQAPDGEPTSAKRGRNAESPDQDKQ